jgi:hypothetical protein
MSIIQISKIQQRSGDLVDLPQLDEAEFGFATDERRLFIGKTSGEIQNVEVLTAYSPISFDQIDGVVGNISIDANTLANGQVFAYDGNNWVNKGGNAGGYISLGNASNLSIDGGSIGYVLTTDGGGSLSWSPKGIVTNNIQTISANANARMTLVDGYPYTVGTEITINLIDTSGFTPLNGNNYFLQPVGGNIQLYDLYEDSGLTIPVDTSSYGAYPSNTGVAIFNTASSNGGNATGVVGSVQYYTGADFGGDGDFLYNWVTNVLTLNGNANITGTTITPNIVTSNITTGSNITAGTLTGNWTLTAGSQLTATYADLAEYYAGDNAYAPGTVLEFGGDKEVTLAKEESSKLAGVVSHDPAYVMNGNIQTEFPIMVALIGRVKVKTIGWVSKGDMLVSAGNGYAKTCIMTPKIGTVIGKAIENKTDSGEGFVEVLVGRL